MYDIRCIILNLTLSIFYATVNKHLWTMENAPGSNVWMNFQQKPFSHINNKN